MMKTSNEDDNCILRLKLIKKNNKNSALWVALPLKKNYIIVTLYFC